MNACLKKSILFLLMSSCLVPTALLQSAETGILTGRVFEAKTDIPVSGATVLVMHTLLGAAAGMDGFFSVEGVPEGPVSIRVSMLGYRSRMMDSLRVSAGKTTSIEIPMEPAPLFGEPVIVTAAKHMQELGGAFQSVQAVDGNRMALRQSRNIEESLNAVSGLHFNESNISIRGSSGYSVFNVGSRVLLMVDGVPVLTSDLGAVNWRILPLLDVDRIEVVKGAGSALYGSSAMGGVVNIITRAPETKAHLIFRLASGWFDAPAYTEWKWTDRKLHAERAELAFSQRIGGAGLRLGASRSLSTGYMENNELDQWNVSGRLDYAMKNGCRVELSASWMKSREGGFIQWINQNQPFKVPPYNQNDELLYSMLNTYAMLHWPVSASFGLRLRASFLQSELGNQLTAFNPGAFDPGRGPGIELQGDWLPHPLHRVTFGTEWRRDLSGSQYFGTHTGYSISPYAQEEWTVFENLKASAGARLDSHVMEDGENDTRVSPKFGLNFRPRESTSIRFSGGAGFRAATVFEKYITADYSGFNVIPNPDLRPERSWTWDAGFRRAVSDHASLDVAIFQTDYRDMIEPFVNFLGTIQFRNFVRARIRGAEASCESWWWRRRLGLAANWCSMNPLNMEQRSDLPYRPRNFGSLTGSVRLGPSLFQAEWRYASRIRSVEINPLDPRVPVKLLSLRGEVRWRSLTFQACVNNALNYHYTQVERRMGEVRNVNLTIIGKY